jgi:hypothetical protein
MSHFNTSIQTGFARSASEAMFPRLFPDVGWWCPSLNPAMGGTRLWDLSGGQNWGTLTNMANDDWVVSGGKYALDFDNTNDQVVMSSIPEIRTGPFTVSLWYYPFSVSGVNQIFAQWLAIGGFGMIGFRSGSALAWQIGNRVTTAAVFTANTWHHVVCFRQENGTLRAMINGVLDAGSIPAANQSSTEPFVLGGPISGAGTGAGNCQIDDTRIYGRALSFGEARQLYTLGRGNMPLRRRRRYAGQAAGGFKGYWATRQHLIGSGVY